MATGKLQNNNLTFVNASAQNAVKLNASTGGTLLMECDGSFNSGFVKIGGVANPTSNQQVATKAYVDGASPASAVLLAPSGTQTITTHPLALTSGTASTSSTTGALVVTGGIGASGNIHSAGDVFAVNVHTTSDERKKENIETLETDDRFDKIRPVSFDWKYNGKPSHGVIAQEIQELYPEMVSQDDYGNYSVEYLQIIAVLIAEVQKLKSV